MKPAKQLKCKLSSKTVSLKHVHVTWVSQHGLHNPKTIESNVHMIIVTGLQKGGSWAKWKFYRSQGSRAGYDGKGPGAG